MKLNEVIIGVWYTFINSEQFRYYIPGKNIYIKINYKRWRNHLK